MAAIPARRHSATAMAAYNDLLSLLLDEAVSEIRGAPVRRLRGERAYWYDRYRIGSDTRERYLGEDSEALRSRIERHAALKEAREARRRERARLVRLLRSERFLGLDTTTGSLLSAMARAGVFRLGGVLAGTHAFRAYEGELGFRLGLDAAAVTLDIDVASFERLSVALARDDGVDPDLERVFHDLDFAPAPSLDGRRTWRWRQTRGEALVEFLTPSFEPEEGLRDLPALGVSARALHHLNYLIAEPIDSALIYRDGVLVRAPRPERFAVHKLIVADRRLEGPQSAKARKDRAQAELLIRLLAEDRPTDLLEAWDDAMGRGPRWRARLERTLEQLPNVAEALRGLR